MADDENEASAWVSVLRNSKEGRDINSFYRKIFSCFLSVGALKEAFSEPAAGSSPRDSGFREIQQRIISYIKTLPGNTRCCDCNGTNG